MTGPTSRTRREMVSTMRAAKGRPRRGLGVWRCLLELLPETPRVARPTYEAWYAMGHEVTHALLLGMSPPFSSEEINRRLMALSRRTRIDHEIRVSAAQYQIASNVTGARALSPAARRWMAAIGGATSMMLELHYGGNVLRVYDLQVAIDHNALILAETKRITEAMWRRAERIMRAHPPDRDVDRAMSVIEDAMRERERKRKRTRPTGQGETMAMKSNWEDYKRAAAALAGEHATGPDLRTRVAYLGLGLAGEAGEAEQAVADGDASQILVELGDCAFHLALVEVAFGERAAASDVRPPNVVRAACEVDECCKRALVLRNVGLGRLRSALAWCRDSLADLARRHVPGGLAEVLRVSLTKCEGIARARDASGDTIAARESMVEDFLCGLRAAGPTEGVEFGSAAPGISANGPLWLIVARMPGNRWCTVQVPVESLGVGDAAGARAIAHKVAIELTRERIRDLGPMPTLPPFEAHKLLEYRADPCRSGAAGGDLPCDGPNVAALESPQS